MAKKRSKQTPEQVETLVHDEASRKNIPTAEYPSVRARSAWPTSAATATSTRSSAGAARTSRTGPTW